MTKNNNKTNEIITADVLYARKDGRIDFTIHIPSMNKTITETFQNLDDAFHHVLAELKDNLNDVSIPTIRDCINNAYHRHMKNVLDKIIQRRVRFTGGTRFDYQNRYV